MQLTYNKKIFSLLFLTLVIRILTVFIIGKTPCMDITYFAQADRILHSAGKVDIYITPSYGFILYFLNIIFHSLYISSAVVYILFSFGAALMSWLIARDLFDERSGLLTLLLLLFFPNLTVAVAGYSHTVVVSSFFILLGVYILLRFSSSGKNYFYPALFFSLTTVAGTYIRPECVLILGGLSLFIFLRNSQALKQKIYFMSLSLLIIISGIFLHAELIKYKSASQYPSAFSDSKYVYITYVCTFSDIKNASLGQIGAKGSAEFSDSVSLKLSEDAFGSPESNHWSIFRAIKKNPKVALTHALWVAKQCLFDVGHPLFCPFYIYFLAGVGIFFLIKQRSTKALILLYGIFFISLVPLAFAHAEIRYLMNCVFPIVFLAAFGITQFGSTKKVNAVSLIIVAANFIIYLIYLINNMRLDSLCG